MREKSRAPIRLPRTSPLLRVRGRGRPPDDTLSGAPRDCRGGARRGRRPGFARARRRTAVLPVLLVERPPPPRRPASLCLLRPRRPSRELKLTRLSPAPGPLRKSLCGSPQRCCNDNEIERITARASARATEGRRFPDVGAFAIRAPRASRMRFLGPSSAHVGRRSGRGRQPEPREVDARKVSRVTAGRRSVRRERLRSELREVAKAHGRRSEERRVGKECRFRWSPYH